MNQKSNETDNNAVEQIKAKDWYFYFRPELPIIIRSFIWTCNLYDIAGQIMFDPIINLN